MSAPQGPPPPGGDVNRGNTVVAITWAQAAIAIVIVAARFWSRILMKNVGVDDWLMLFTLVVFVAWACILTYSASLGGFRHLYYLGPEALEVAKVNYMIQVFIVFSYVTGKAAVGFLVLRIMGASQSRWRKWLIYTVLSMTALIGSLNCIFTYVQCDPPRALWTPGIEKHCWDPSVQANFAIFTSSENIFADVVLAIVPGTIIYGLNMDFNKRINLCILLGLGLIAAVCGIVKTTYLTKLTAKSDLTWETYDLILWSGAESWVIIVCGSVPTLKALWDRYVKGKMPGSYGSNGSKGSSGKRSYGNSSQASSYRMKPQRGHAQYRKQDSVSSQENALVGENPGEGIRATTDIEIASSRQRNMV